MPSNGILFSLATFLYALTWPLSPAWGAPTDAKSYSHLTFSADRIQDQLPLKPSQAGQRPITEIANTKFRATIDVYFVPGDMNAPAFSRSHFNVRRENHSWREIDTGFQSIAFFSAEEYQGLVQTANSMSQGMSRLPPGSLDYNETPMPANSLVMSVVEITGGVAKLLEKVSDLWDASAPKVVAPPVLEFHVALSQTDFTQPRSEFPVQARLSFEYYNLAVHAQSILYRKMLYGSGKVLPLTDAELTELSRLLTLSKSNCAEMLKGQGQRKN